MDLPKDSSDISPLSEFFDVEGVQCYKYFENKAKVHPMHIVVGTELITKIWISRSQSDRASLPIDWFVFAHADCTYLTREIIEILEENQHPVRISAAIWENSIPNVDFQTMKNCVAEIEEVLLKHPQHKVSFPTCQFVPDQSKHWEKVDALNDLLIETNVNHGLSPHKLHKPMMQNKKGKGLRVKQSYWFEFNSGFGQGRYLRQKPLALLAKNIAIFHQTGFRDDEEESILYLNVKPHSFPISQVMKNPQMQDLEQSVHQKETELLDKKSLIEQDEKELEEKVKEVENLKNNLEERSKKLKRKEEEMREKEEETRAKAAQILKLADERRDELLKAELEVTRTNLKVALAKKRQTKLEKDLKRLNHSVKKLKKEKKKKKNLYE